MSMNRAILTNSFTFIRYLTRGNIFILKMLHYVKGRFFDTPRTMMIHPSYTCSFNCPYCYLQQKNGECLPYERWKELITEFKKNGGYSVDFLGGEPLEYEFFSPLTEFIISKKLLLNIFSNGENINRKLLESIKHYNKKIIFVIKFDSAFCYQKYYNRPLENIIQKIELLNEYNFTTMAFIVATSENAQSVDEIISSCKKLHVVPIFERYAPVKNDDENDKMQLTPSQWANILSNVGNYWKDYNDIITNYSVVNGSTCSCSSNNIAIMQNGDVKLCPEAHDDLNYGNVKTNKIKLIWKSSRAKRMNLLKTPTECKACHHEAACRGGCKVYSYQLKGRTDIRDPLCFNQSYPTTYSHCAFSVTRLIK